MAKTKYVPETVADIIRAIEETGRDEDGWRAGKISSKSFYEWQLKHSEFKEKIAQAKKFYRDHLPVTLRRDATAQLAKHLRNGHEEHWFRKEVVRDGEGNIIMTKETQSRVIRPVPGWVYDRIFGKGTPVIEAMQLLLSEGVALPEHAEIVKRGLDAIDSELKELGRRTVVIEAESETSVDGSSTTG